MVHFFLVENVVGFVSDAFFLGFESVVDLFGDFEVAFSDVEDFFELLDDFGVAFFFVENFAVVGNEVVELLDEVVELRFRFFFFVVELKKDFVFLRNFVY